MAGRRVEVVRTARLLRRRRRLAGLQLDDVLAAVVEHHAHVARPTVFRVINKDEALVNMAQAPAKARTVSTHQDQHNHRENTGAGDAGVGGLGRRRQQKTPVRPTRRRRRKAPPRAHMIDCPLSGSQASPYLAADAADAAVTSAILFAASK